MDARQRKSQAALFAAIIDLATTRSVSSLTVADITDRAGVNRSTFYAHATSASELLCAALRSELDAIRALFLAEAHDGDLSEATRNVNLGVLDNLEHHAALYLRAFDDPSDDSGLRTMLSGHFRATIELALADRSLDIPGLDQFSAEERAFISSSAAGFVSAGSAAIIEEWLRLPAPRDRDMYVRVVAKLMPEWWPVEVTETRAA
ncbi:TetR family transcriptional regulator [Microbacteriaceae bacterium VKM Ac-2854]|nr:TetR family transcriptional regulator [Microbacteriaceae bacterium VKM Ac-2854]